MNRLRAAQFIIFFKHSISSELAKPPYSNPYGIVQAELSIKWDILIVHSTSALSFPGIRLQEYPCWGEDFMMQKLRLTKFQTFRIFCLKNWLRKSLKTMSSLCPLWSMIYAQQPCSTAFDIWKGLPLKWAKKELQVCPDSCILCSLDLILVNADLASSLHVTYRLPTGSKRPIYEQS